MIKSKNVLPLALYLIEGVRVEKGNVKKIELQSKFHNTKSMHCYYNNPLSIFHDVKQK